ncbi:AsnC family transcriptional regulator [Clostridia bacterium]|nr:AsnC family transcriptional regulator [Clostridia bacterium]
MKLSTKGRYGLRAFVDLAVYGGKEPISLTGIAKRQDISPAYLEQLMGKLKRANLVESVRGANGGYRLARTTDEISVGDVLRALEGDLGPAECVSDIDSSYACGCGDSDSCVSRLVWKRIHDSINDAVDSIKIQELVEENKKLTSQAT